MKTNPSKKTDAQESPITSKSEPSQPRDPSRRSFLGKAGGAATVVMAAGAIGLEPLMAAGATRLEPMLSDKRLSPRSNKIATANSRVFVRRDFATLTRRQIETYRRGVEVMMSRPATDPTSWTYQANIHGTFDTPVLPGWNTCQHGNFFFPPWHRMHLFWFERIIRAACGDPSFALPYWNWSNATTRAIPLPFREPSSRSNPLFVQQRNPEINAGGMPPFSAVQIWQAFGFDNFSSPRGSGQSFGGQRVPAPVHLGSPHGQFESRPHDIVHILVGGDNGWMADPNLAARDPVFWPHHANVDRLWARWLNLMHGRANPNSEIWLDTPFLFFDENGDQVMQTGRQILDTVGQLNYIYDDDPGPLPLPPPVPNSTVASASESQARQAETLGVSDGTPVALNGRAVRVSISVPAGARSKLTGAARASSESSLLLHLDDIKFERAPGVFYEIYLNLPEGEAPDPQGPYFAGTLALFGMKGHHAEAGHEPITQTVDIRGAVGALQVRGKWSEGDLTVTFVPRGVDPPRGRQAVSRTTQHRVEIGRIWISSE